MQISFSPIRSEATLSLSVDGDAAILNGVRFDFAAMQDGDILLVTAIQSGAIAGNVARAGGQINLTVYLPHAEDAAEAVRFPADVTLSSGPCDAPGLVPFEGTPTEGVINWDQLIVPAAAMAMARAEWRASRVISKLDLILALVAAGVIGEEGALATGIPPEFDPLIAAMPNPPRNELRIRWAHLVDVPRMHPLILAVQGALGWSDEQVDALFGWVA